MRQRIKFVFSVLLAVVVAGATQPGATQAQDTKLDAEEVARIGVEAYIFGYPLVTMEMTRRISTNVAKVEGTRGPMGQLVNLRSYPSASFRDVYCSER